MTHAWDGLLIRFENQGPAFEVEWLAHPAQVSAEVQTASRLFCEQPFQLVLRQPLKSNLPTTASIGNVPPQARGFFLICD